MRVMLAGGHFDLATPWFRRDFRAPSAHSAEHCGRTTATHTRAAERMAACRWVHAASRRDLERLLSGVPGNGRKVDGGQAPADQAGVAGSDAGHPGGHHPG
jgi:hypothetical protein